MARQKDLLVEAGRKVGIVWLPPHILICCLLSVCGTVRGCYSGGTAGSIPGRDEPGMRYISPYFNGYIGRFVTGKFKIHN